MTEQHSDSDEAIARKVPLARLLRDLRAAGRELGIGEARFLVDAYYLIQDDRKRSASQVRALADSNEPASVLAWFADLNRRAEAEIRTELGRWADTQPVAVWAQTIRGIGPVLAAGLSAHIEIEKAPTVGHIWRFAGVDPTVKWEKGQKRPWNATLKTIQWKIGESFVKVQNLDGDIYGHVYAERKAWEAERNERLLYREQAEAALAAKRIGKDTEAYKAYSIGKLPPGHLHARAKRYAVKLFLSSLHEVAFYLHHGTLPPLPYILTQPGHSDWFQAPHADLVPGLLEAQAAARALHRAELTR